MSELAEYNITYLGKMGEETILDDKSVRFYRGK
jgi:hypothetical protein